MRTQDILKLASMPAAGPSYPAGPYRFVDREYMVITYETDPELIREQLPEPLQPIEQPLVHYEWISMPDSSGFGSYTESGMVIPCRLDGQDVNFVAQMYLDDDPPIVAGREIWGFPKKYAHPKLEVIKDTLTGTLSYAGQLVALGTMGYKHASPSRPPSLSQQYEQTWRPERCDRIALVLQGGGALGAYQAGVYQAMHEAGIEPDWVSGVSIGAVNSAIIAGNPPHRRLHQLRTFWERITERKIWAYTPDGDVFRKARNATSSWMTMTYGQPGFFGPRFPNPWMSLAGAQSATSYYDSGPLRETLLELVDFSLLNDQRVRFSVGAVNVLTGNFIYFDNAHEEIEPEHVMASGALPPALPMVKIGTDHFWDGGIVSNTPLQHLLDQDDRLNTLIFQVDLFSARGVLPRDIQDVLARHKDIMYSSRTRYNTNVYRRIHTGKTRLHQALEKVPEELLSDEERRLKEELADLPEIALLHIIYQQKAYEGHAKDYEFSGTSMREHWQSGYEDTRRTLKRKEWLVMPPDGSGIVVHDVHRETAD